jgi:hypothetical protein
VRALDDPARIELSEADSSGRAWALLARAASDPSTRMETANEVRRLGKLLGDASLVVFAHEAMVVAWRAAETRDPAGRPAAR